MEPNEAVEYLSWDMKTLALSNLIQQELEEEPPEVAGICSCLVSVFLQICDSLGKPYGLLVEKPENYNNSFSLVPNPPVWCFSLPGSPCPSACPFFMSNI